MRKKSSMSKKSRGLKQAIIWLADSASRAQHAREYAEEESDRYERNCEKLEQSVKALQEKAAEYQNTLKEYKRYIEARDKKIADLEKT